MLTNQSTLSSLPSISEVIARHDLMARKALGQHFLTDKSLLTKIAELAGDLTGHIVFEIGAGPGGLTRALLETNAAKVVAVEKDRRCLAALAEVNAVVGDRLQVMEADALRLSLPSLVPDNIPCAIVSNLPYNVGTALLLQWLKQMPCYAGMTLMFQREVADRLTAAPHSEDYGRLSVITQFCCNAKRVLDVPASAFTPRPKVESAVVHLLPRSDRPTDISLEVLGQVTAAAFGQRRKMLRSSLRALGGEELLSRAGIASDRRAEELSLTEFETLTRLVQVDKMAE